MAKQTKPRRRKMWKIISLISASLLMVGVVAIPTFLILDTTGVVGMTQGVNRQYTMTFKVDDSVYYEKTLYRGAPIDYSDVQDPAKDGSLYRYYTFSGWDLNGDHYPDLLPNKAYRNYVAVAIFREWRVNAY